MKRLVVCADGTWNERDQTDDRTHLRHATNVTKVARAIRPRDEKGIDQVVFYHDGVGTHPGMDKIVGGAFGDGIEGNIRDLYRSIVYNYDDGDEIFMFGFSRGAFTVRTLAGFMSTFGVLQKSDDFYVPDLYAEYRTGQSAQDILKDPHFRRMGAPRACPPIKFIGVWDTVGALGLPGRFGRHSGRDRPAGTARWSRGGLQESTAMSVVAILRMGSRTRRCIGWWSARSVIICPLTADISTSSCRVSTRH
jgi:uncharacterized protein (DUF2235 family)